MKWNNSNNTTLNGNNSMNNKDDNFRPLIDINTDDEKPIFSNKDVISHSHTNPYSKDESKSVKNSINKNEQYPQVSVFDVAKYILEKLGEPCSTMKLQKLVYYCQVWFLVWEDRPLFNEKIEAWSNGPVVRRLFNFHRGFYRINKYQMTLGNSDRLSKLQKEDIDSVLEFYGNKTSQWLIDQTHSELPWIEARKGLAPFEKSDREISRESIVNYYSSLD